MAKSSKGRHRKQKTQASYTKAREDLQLNGQLPTEPTGALRDERVDPATQDSQRFPGLDRLAVLNDGAGGWSVPEHVKRKVIEQNSEVLFERKTAFKEINGVTVEYELPPDRRAQQDASKILLLADQREYERQNPERAGKAKGGVSVSVEQNVAVVESLDRLVGEARLRAREGRGPVDPGEQPDAEVAE